MKNNSGKMQNILQDFQYIALQIHQKQSNRTAPFYAETLKSVAKIKRFLHIVGVCNELY